jgi:hypothetical protein
MDNLYKSKFPTRSLFQTCFDILQLTDTMFTQLQDTANHYNPNTDFELDFLPTLQKKCKPSSFEQISTVDSPHTLLGICVLESGAHKNRKSEFHKAGGVFETCSVLFKALWDSVGKTPELNAWYLHFSQDNAVTDTQGVLSKTFAKLCMQTYLEKRKTKVDDWARDPDCDTEHCTTWVNEGEREVHITCRGTKLTPDDLWQDFDILMGYQTDISQRLNEYVKKVTNEYKGWLFSISGHSMGAYAVLEMISNNIHREFNEIYLFNCPLSPIAPSKTQIVNADQRIKLYLNLGDPISNCWAIYLDYGRPVCWNPPLHSPYACHKLIQWT